MVDSLATQLVQHTDARGTFVELLHNDGGQVSFSTSTPGVTRGNHWHSRKREKFIVVSGEAIIHLRKLDTDEIDVFYVCGGEPEAIEIPPEFVHNITNVGNDVMHLIIWCNESFNSADPDTNAERV